MNSPRVFYFIAALACLTIGAAQAAEPEPGREIKGRVTEVTGNLVNVARDREFDPAAGDAAEIYLPVPGQPQGAVVASGKVISIGDTFVTIRLDQATGTVVKGYRARIHAMKPTPRLAPRTQGNWPAGISVLQPLKVGQWMTLQTISDFKEDDADPKDPRPVITFICSRGVRISGDGSKILFASKEKGTFLINADGSNLIRLGDKGMGGDAYNMIDISFDGGKVVWYDASGLHFASNDGTGRPVVGEGFHIDALRMNADGTSVFVLNKDKGKGIYSVPTDGGEMRALVRPDVEADKAKLRGEDIPEPKFGDSLDACEDGSRLVFQYGRNAYGYASQGGLQRLTQSSATQPGIRSVRISGDGKKVALLYDNPRELSIRDWDDLVKNKPDSAPHNPVATDKDYMQMTRDGRVAILHESLESLRMFSPGEKGDRDLVLVPQRWVHRALPSPYIAAISSNGLRACFAVNVPRGDNNWPLHMEQWQLAVVNINPPAIGSAPPLEDIRLSTQSIQADGSTQVTVSARTTAADVLSVAFQAMRDGRALEKGPVPTQMAANVDENLDNPLDGKIWTGTFRFDARNEVTPGPITLRITVVDKSGRAVAVDVEGLTAKAPAP